MVFLRALGARAEMLKLPSWGVPFDGGLWWNICRGRSVIGGEGPSRASAVLYGSARRWAVARGWSFTKPIGLTDQ